MIDEYSEIIKVFNQKDKEIESFMIDINMSDSDKISFILKKGHNKQKLGLISNLQYIIKDEMSLEVFFLLIFEKFYDLEQNVQIAIIDKISEILSKSKYVSIKEKIKDEYISQLLVIIVKNLINDEKYDKNVNFINLFNIIINAYKERKISINKDFITYVVNLASFGKSAYSRKYSIVFTTGFFEIVKDYNNELIDRFSRSTSDMELIVRIAVSKGFFSMGKYIIKENTSFMQFLNNTESYLSSNEDIEVRSEAIISLIHLYKDIKIQYNSNEIIEDFYAKKVLVSFEDTLINNDYNSKNLISSNTLESIRLKIIKCYLNNIDEFFDCRIHIKKFFYLNFLFVKKMIMNREIKEFVIDNFINLIKFVNTPYSPEKQKSLYQNHVKQNIGNDKFPDLEIPKKSVITLKKIDSNNDLNRKNIKDFNTKDTKFNFSSDWTMELLKAVLETIFSGKIDEISESESNNSNLIYKFFILSDELVQNLKNEHIKLISEVMSKKMFEETKFLDVFLNFSKLTDKYFNIYGFLDQNVCNILIENIDQIYKILFHEYDLYFEEENHLEKNEKSKGIAISSKFKKYRKDENNSSFLSNSFSSIESNFIDYESNQINIKKNPKNIILSEWRLYSSFYTYIYQLLKSNISYKDKLNYVLNNLFVNLKQIPNYQVQLKIIELIVKYYGLLPRKDKEELSDKIENLIIKNSSFTIRKQSFIFFEMFIIEYSFHYFKTTKFFPLLLGFFKDFHLIKNVLIFYWKIYPFVYSNEKIKNTLFLEIKNLRNLVSYKINDTQKDMANNNSFFHNKSGLESNGYCSRNKSVFIIKEIEDFIKKSKNFELYNTYIEIIESDQIKYIKICKIFEEIERNEKSKQMMEEPLSTLSSLIEKSTSKKLIPISKSSTNSLNASKNKPIEKQSTLTKINFNINNRSSFFQKNTCSSGNDLINYTNTSNKPTSNSLKLNSKHKLMSNSKIPKEHEKKEKEL